MIGVDDTIVPVVGVFESLDLLEQAVANVAIPPIRAKMRKIAKNGERVWRESGRGDIPPNDTLAAGACSEHRTVGERYELDVTAVLNEVAAKVDRSSGSVTNTATVTLPAGVIDPSPENHTDSAVTPVVPDGSSLPITGSDLATLVLAAIFLFGVGSILKEVSRGRRRIS